jgi:hypothetical protein
MVERGGDAYAEAHCGQKSEPDQAAFGEANHEVARYGQGGCTRSGRSQESRQGGHAPAGECDPSTCGDEARRE